MKKNNKTIIRFFKILNLLIIGLIIFNILLFSNIILNKYHLFPPYYLTVFIVFLIFITNMTGNQFYAIDTKGETITFETKNIGLLSIFNSNIKKIDLPKYKLVKYEFQSGIISKFFILYIKSKKKESLTKVKFRIAFISNNNAKNILNELKQIVKNNREIENKEKE